MKAFPFPLLIFFSLVFLCPCPATGQNTDTTLGKYEHKTKIFRLRIPEGYKTNTRFLQLDDKHAALFSEAIAVKKSGENKKTYKARLEQTIGAHIREDDLPELLDQQVRRYKEMYKAQDGRLLKETREIFHGSPGVEIVMRYQDPKLGEQHLRARILFSDYSRLDVTFTGTEDQIFTYTTDKYFDSVRLFDGLVDKNEKDWKKFMPESGIYSAFLPPLAKPYVKYEPIVKSNARTELASMQFYDPVWNEMLFYNIHAYRFNAPVDRKNAQKVIFSKHLKKFRVVASRLRYKIIENSGNLDFFETAAKIPPPPGYEYLNRIRIRARIKDNSLLVQEIMGSDKLVNAPFVETLLKLTKFRDPDEQNAAIKE